MSFAYASIKSKIRKFQVVLECRKRIAECSLSCDLLTSAAVVVSYCMIFPVGSDNAKEGCRLRTSIGWPAPRGTGVFFCFLTSLNTDFFLPFLIQSRKSKKRAWEIDLKIPMKDPGERHANDHARAKAPDGKGTTNEIHLFGVKTEVLTGQARETWP